ncbi:hypothetical protein CFBP7900_40750 [Xanthomonas hortorum pv. carotae]|uniref:Uncharacterized protein n=1 Tax=Xanthomonas hortorum pv. carotae TaxID=487904 RepID=A0A6V7FLJ3_9XANT|nr:hypothetical protein CFBP7900_40750 [Xanthomonas hortorum pv. carotae]CAD0363977.1 hypothetical protein CFBP7900_40750 [Xanthomonas hortorum pv. carotae]
MACIGGMLGLLTSRARDTALTVGRTIRSVSPHRSPHPTRSARLNPRRLSHSTRSTTFSGGNSEAVRKAVRCFSLLYLALLIYEQLEQHISHRRRIDHLPATVWGVGVVCMAPKILKRSRRRKTRSGCSPSHKRMIRKAKRAKRSRATRRASHGLDAVLTQPQSCFWLIPAIAANLSRAWSRAGTT